VGVLGETCERFDGRVHARWLMTNPLPRAASKHLTANRAQDAAAPGLTVDKAGSGTTVSPRGGAHHCSATSGLAKTKTARG
jgi:hypothetical protein